MATSSANHVGSTNTLAYFTDWAKAVSDFLASIGWLQTNDTGQVVWTATVLTMTEVAVGATAVYSYSSYAGPTPRVGMSVAVTGFANGNNNVTGVLTAVSGGASGTVTMVLTTQANEVHAGSGTTTALAAAPAANNYVYEIWGMGDALQATSPFYLKIEYGTGSSANGPNLYVTIGTATNLAGTLSGNVSSRVSVGNNTGNTTTAYPCELAGSTGWFGCILWRNSTGTMARIFCVDRSKDASGYDTGDYATLLTCGYTGVTQQSIFKAGTLQGVATLEYSSASRWGTILPITATTGIINGQTHNSPVIPLVGQVDNPSLAAVVVLAADYAENDPIPVSLFGSTHTYKFTKSTGIPVVGSQGVGYPAIRYE